MVSSGDDTEEKEEGRGNAVGLKELKPPDNLENGIIRWETPDIEFVMPAHTGLKLLLTRVESYPRSKLVGHLKVTPERCVGFCILEKEELALTGSDLIEMAAQLLGVWGYHYKEIWAQRHRRFLHTTITRAEFHKPIRVGETVCMEIAFDKIRVREKISTGQFVIRGEEFVVKVGGEVRGIIFGITLMSTSEKEVGK